MKNFGASLVVALEELEDDHIVWMSGRKHARRRPWL
jgi:hypothetical protein